MRERNPVTTFACIALILVAFSVCQAAERRSEIVVAVEKAAPAVVNINTEKIVTERLAGKPRNLFFRDFTHTFPARRRQQQSLGSGVIIDSAGLILTNEHVILKAAHKIVVTTANGQDYDATLMGSSGRFDIALLTLENPKKIKFPTVDIGRSDDLMIGETVIAIGNPFGLQHTVTSGVISALHRVISADDDRYYRDFIQIDASINPGSSGGPLLNINGEVIGINTAIYQSAEGIGFAIPVDRAIRVGDLLQKYGLVPRAYFGVRVQAIEERLRKIFNNLRFGVLVNWTDPDGPAAKAGVKRGDIIVALNDEAIMDAEQFNNRIEDVILGESLTFSLKRKMGIDNYIVESTRIPPKLAKEIAAKLGYDVVENSEKVAWQYRLSTPNGMVIARVKRGSLAARNGLRVGDVVIQVNNRSIGNEAEYQNAMIEAAYAENILLIILRGDSYYYVVF